MSQITLVWEDFIKGKKVTRKFVWPLYVDKFLYLCEKLDRKGGMMRNFLVSKPPSLIIFIYDIND